MSFLDGVADSADCKDYICCETEVLQALSERRARVLNLVSAGARNITERRMGFVKQELGKYFGKAQDLYS